MSDPERWSARVAELTPAERRAFAAGRRGPEVPGSAQRAVWEGLAATLAASSAAAATGAGTTGVTAAVVLKQLAVGALLGATVAGGAAVYGRVSARSPAPSATPASASAHASLPAFLPTAAPAVPAPSSVVSVAGSGPALERSVGSVHPAPVPSARPGAVTYGSGQASFPTGAPESSNTAESRRLVAARSLLRSGRASAALSALAAIRSDFPGGALAQEREALTVEALLASGDRAGARARAAAFLEQYPESPHAESVRKALK